MAESSPRQPRKDPPIAAHGSGGLLLEDHLSCSLCRDVLNAPVTTGCGHNFCKTCLTGYWDKSRHCVCPSCKAEFSKRPELKINTALKESLDHYKKKYPVLCDVCTGVNIKTLKSCLDCGLTFCKSHLEPHNNVGKLKKHKLINPVKNLEDYICQKHEKPLEMFCKDDQMYICQFCTEGHDKNHRFIPIEKMSEEIKKQTEVQQRIRDTVKKIQEIKHSVELSKKNTEKEKADSVEVFAFLIRCIEKRQAELLEMMEENQKAAERQAQRFIKELEWEIAELERRDADILHTDEHLNLLQVYPSVFRPPPTQNWPNIGIDTHLNVMELPNAMLKLQKTLNEKLCEMQNERLKETAPAQLKKIQHYAENVTLDPETAHPNLALSENLKEVRRGVTKKNLPDTPKRFTCYFNVLGQQGFSSRRFYYEVQVDGKTDWSLGVATASVNRKGNIILTPQTGFWTIKLKNGKDCTARDNRHITLFLREKPQKVGVFVDYEGGLVSFYDVENRSHIYSFTGQFFTEELYPYFSPGENSVIISPF